MIITIYASEELQIITTGFPVKRKEKMDSETTSILM